MAADSTPLPDEAPALFRESPEGFIAARDALAARLRDEGRADDAAAVKRLRKPTVVAWALDQLASRDPDGVHTLLDAGAEVRAAQQSALSSKRGAAERLRAAGVARTSAVSGLTAEAAAVLAESGKDPGAHVEAIARALETCSTDPEAGSALAAGTLERPPATAAGFGDVFGLTALEGGATAGSPAEGVPDADEEGAAPARTRRTAGRADLTALRGEVARLRRDRDGAVRRARKAADAADGFAHELEGMQRRLEVIERKHADAAAKAAAGALEVKQAERALRRATDRLEEAGDG
jgi:hypothetical protein